MKKIIFFSLITSLCFILAIAPNTTKADVTVRNVTELVNAVADTNAGGDKTIILEDGTYSLDDMLGILVDGVTVRSSSGNRDAVTIRGDGRERVPYF